MAKTLRASARVGASRGLTNETSSRHTQFPIDGMPSWDMWRYSAHLPIGDGPIAYPLRVGGTPLIAPPVLRDELGTPHLWLKDETRGPSGSNKDRATALVLEQALRSGVDTVSCASTGNVAVSLSIGAAACGIRAVVFVPEDAEQLKLDLMQYAGATVLRIREGYRAAFELSRRASEAFGWLDRNTGINRSTVDAKKTVAFEIWEQLGHVVPDVTVVPVGDAVTLCALALGFEELRRAGNTDRVPRIVGVQATGCRPVADAWRTGTPIEPVVPDTIADGIAVGAPLFGVNAIQDVAASGGAFVDVSDEQMLAAARGMGRHAGIVAEPAGAAAMAGLRQALALGHVDRTEQIAVLVTGSGLKMPQLLRSAEPAPVISANLEEVEQVLASSAHRRA